MLLRNRVVRLWGVLPIVVAGLLLAASAHTAEISFSCDGTGADPCAFCGETDTRCVFVEIDATITDLRGAELVFQRER